MCPHGCFGLPPAGNFDSLREKVAAAKHRLQWANRWGLTAGERVTHYTAVIQNLDLMLGDGTRSADELDDLKESVLWFRKVLAVWLDDLRDVATARAQARSVIRAYMRERRV
jgi:hypothetical protein